ncbi:hypothetical protein Mal64_05210 [Pseudobythopirellula maris]|uniref:Uncharacterized protein n=1 Tax=Pseudobythopirellula maris TaxID=2527991 RepID=A0A5C5ZT08_9BACT|nr:hypothetical protein [Pseudobythopirellula maris]TWT90137.1 hypothetical protein Mal64_05210 [Pseudobythopirellula maris]
MSLFHRYAVALFLAAGVGLVSGCQQGDTYTTEKPVIEDDASDVEIDGERDEALLEDADESVREPVDNLTPDEEKVDIRTPLGDVQVGEDPLTGDTNVNVDSE